MGKVYLIGAGPSNIGLFTLQGKAILEQADVVVYDALVSAEILLFAREDAKFINVGKRSSNHTMVQADINQVLLEEAQKGQVVARLKGGDPFLFGRGGEELELLAKYNIPFEVIPGVTSSIAVPAYNGIPVTHRDFTSSVHIVTGHKKAGDTYDINFKALVDTKGTLVFLMGVAALKDICQGLQDGGMDKDMPAAILQQGTTANQKRIVATLSTLWESVQKQKIQTPAIIVVGAVCSLSKDFGWYENLPLAGKKVLVPRPKALSSTLAQKLRDRGAQVVEMPTIKIQPLDTPNITNALTHLDAYNWLVLTSPTGVDMFFNKVLETGQDLRSLHHLKFAVIGNGTAKALKERGIIADLVPSVFDGEHLAYEMVEQGIVGESILVPRAEKGQKSIIEILISAGAKVTDLAIYTTEFCKNDIIAEKITDIRYIMFTSSSTVEAFVQGNPSFDITQVTALCIGKKTEATAKSLNFKTKMAEESTMDSLISLLEKI